MFGVPASHCYGNLLLAHTNWLGQLVRDRSLPDVFPEHKELDPDDLRALLRQGEAPPEAEWILLEVERHPRRSGITVCPLPQRRGEHEGKEDSLCFAELLRYVAQSNLVNGWKENFKVRRRPHEFAVTAAESENASGGLDHDAALLEVLCRLHPKCPVIPAGGDAISLPQVSSPPASNGSHLTPALVVIVEAEFVSVLRLHSKHSVHQALTFSPAFFGDSAHKLLFVVYQILCGMRDAHSLGLTVGDISLRDVTIKGDDNFVSLKPRVSANLLEMKEEKLLVNLADDTKAMLESLQSALKEEICDADSCAKDIIVKNYLGSMLNLWTSGRVSNYDYIMFLNYLSGRSYSNPNFYPVIPWVRDFSGRVGGWRDLSKSKFRLNKGDAQLDLTYDESAAAAAEDNHKPHHVTDVLSEITYYVYKARNTSKSVLCKHVRNRWVPAEYPSSMRRLQAWTPDECIPDFFTDPTIFKSIHEDLPDLEVPDWCQGPEDFVVWHRDALESSQVSDKLHQWIDLTFGYKLSGGSAVRAKNVCLHLVDNHSDLRQHGVVQLFSHPHPQRRRDNFYWMKTAPRLDLLSSINSDSDSDLDDTTEGDNKSRSSLAESTESKQQIVLPREFEPLFKLQEVEVMNAFMSKSGTSFAIPPKEKGVSGGKNLLTKELSQRKIVRDMQVLGCLILELVLPKKFLSLGRHADLAARFKACRTVVEAEPHLLPSSIRQTVHLLLMQHDFVIESSDRYPAVSELGLPPPSAFQFLQSQVSSFAFPKNFAILANILRQVEDLDDAAACVQLEDEDKVQQKVSEFKVKLVASELGAVAHELSSGDVELMLPLVKMLLTDRSTAIMAAWYLFDPVAKILGRRSSTDSLLMPMLSIYECNAQTSKHLKLYHRTFLQFLLVRFGTQTFLRYFSTFLIEAVGGYRDYEDTEGGGKREGLERCWIHSESHSQPPSRMSSPSEDFDETLVSQSSKSSATAAAAAASNEETFAEGEVFSFDSLSLSDEVGGGGGETSHSDEFMTKGVIYIPPATVTYDDEEEEEDGNYQKAIEHLRRQKGGGGGNISQVAGESVLWLAHRIGPVLTARHISRNLLRMLNLCYLETDSSVALQQEKFGDQKIRIGPKKIHGDSLADNVLECLGEIACLYGDHFILLQYLPYAWDVLSACKKKLNPNLEAGLLGVMSLLHHIIPYLSDSLLMKELPDNMLANIMFPALQIMSSRSSTFHTGWRLRQALVFRFLDVAYLIGLRIGEEMSRSHLTPLCAAFFSSFDKVYDRDGRALEIAEESENSKAISAELARVLSPEVAYAAYVAFYNLMGRAHLDSSIINYEVVKTLCLLHQEKVGESQLPRPATFNCLNRGKGGDYQQNPSSPLSSGRGNSLLQHSSYESHGNDDLHSLIAKEINSSTARHLKGNWLAYWEHETGRSEFKFNLKQIKLQSFVGHTAGVKTLFVLDNENSFLSGSRDRTAKVWSLRSQGDGSANVACQWTYGLHRKSVFSVLFLDSIRMAVSCDSAIHVWDPFVGSGVHQLDPQRLGGPVHVLTPLSPSSFPTVVMAATSDSLLHLVDCRMGSAAVTDLKISVGSTGLVKALSAGEDGHTVIVGHSSGYISLLDLRTGKLRHAWKAHEGEILNLTALEKEEVLSTSLDQTASIWMTGGGGDGSSRLKCRLSGAQEPVHCVCYVSESGDVVTGTTANRIGVGHNGRRGESDRVELVQQYSKLRADVAKGNLMTMKVLPMNGQLLIGQDNGGLTLVC